MAKAMFVTIRYLGKSLLTGHPKREFADIGGQRFWNCRRFPEQNEDLSYTRPYEFYEKHKAVLDDRKLFIVEFVDSKGKVVIPATQNVPERAELSKELSDKGVIEVEGVFLCPSCDFQIPALGFDANSRMAVHMMGHEE